VSRIAVDLEHTIVNIIIANAAVAIVVLNRYCDRMADTHRRAGSARRDLATAWRTSSWRQKRTRRPGGRPRWFSTRPFCRMYDDDVKNVGVWYRVRTDTDTITGTAEVAKRGRDQEQLDNSTQSDRLRSIATRNVTVRGAAVLLRLQQIK
jgi:hypothetical protein